jgi:hypothetical protein
VWRWSRYSAAPTVITGWAALRSTQVVRPVARRGCPYRHHVLAPQRQREQPADRPGEGQPRVAPAHVLRRAQPGHHPGQRPAGAERGTDLGSARQPGVVGLAAGEGWTITPEDLAVLSPYLTARIQRFGVYATDEITLTPDAYDAHLGVDLAETA